MAAVAASTPLRSSCPHMPTKSPTACRAADSDRWSRARSTTRARCLRDLRPENRRAHQCGDRRGPAHLRREEVTTSIEGVRVGHPPRRALPRPTIVRCKSLAYPLAIREDPFPYVSILEVPPAKMARSIGRVPGRHRDYARRAHDRTAHGIACTRPAGTSVRPDHGGLVNEPHEGISSSCSQEAIDPAGMTMPIGFDFQPHTRVVFGAGAVDRLGELARPSVPTPFSLPILALSAAGHVEQVRRGLDAAGVSVTIFDRVRENPTTREVDQCLEVARAVRPSSSLAWVAAAAWTRQKAAIFILTNGGRMQDYRGYGKATRPMLPAHRRPHHRGDRQRVPVLRPDRRRGHAPEDGLRRPRRRASRSSTPC